MRKEREDARRRHKKEVNHSPKWMICCEGESEVEYLRALVEDLAQGRQHGIQFGHKDCNCDTKGACRRQHKALIDRAEQCASKLTIEKVWVVFDEDGETIEGADEGKRQKFAETVGNWYRTSDENPYLQMAWSRPSFEYWMSLHDGSHKDSGTADVFQSATKELLCKFHRITPEDAKHLKGTKKKQIEKPYLGSYIALGGAVGLDQATESARRHYENDKLEALCQAGKFREFSCGTNMHVLVDALREYFRINFPDAPQA